MHLEKLVNAGFLCIYEWYLQYQPVPLGNFFASNYIGFWIAPLGSAHPVCSYTISWFYKKVVRRL